MKLITNYLEYFISPITGRLISSSGLPPLHFGKIWVGNEDDVAVESVFSIDDFVKNEGDSFTIGDIAIWSDADGQFIKDSGMSIPDLKALADAAAASADASASSAKDSAEAAALAAGFKTAAEAAATSAAADAAAAFTSAAEATAAAVLAATYAGDAADSADDAFDEAVLANNYQKEAKDYRDAAAAAAAAAAVAQAASEAVLASLYSTGIEFVGAITGMGPVNSPILTSFNLSLDQIPYAAADVNLNSQKITNLANGVAANDAVNFSQISGGAGICLLKANNLSDVASVSTSRTNLGLTAVAIQSVTQYDVLVGGASNAITSIGPGSTGQVFQSGGASANPAYSSATYPLTTTINQILYSSAANTIVGLATGNNGILITSSGGVPSISSTLPPAVQGNITALGTIASGVWSGTAIVETKGGTNQTSYILGDLLYSSAANTLAKLAGNTAATTKYLSQTGTGSVSAAPVWATVGGGDITGAALTKTDDTNVTLTLGGTPTTALLRATSLTLGWTGLLGLTRGGTAASLTASNGGIVYSTASALAILAGTSTPGQVLTSGVTSPPSAPLWKSQLLDYGVGAGTNNHSLFLGTNCGTPTISPVNNAYFNTGVGIDALTTIGSGMGNNTAIGSASLIFMSNGSNNAAVGYGSGSGPTTSASNDNCFFGYLAGFNRLTYNQCVLIGSTADCSSTGLTNAIAIGYGASVAASNCMVLGNGVNVGIGTSTPTSLLTVGSNTTAPTTNTNINSYSSTQNLARYALTGNSYWTGGGTSTEGMSFYLGYNSTSNRQMVFLDSSHAKNSSNAGLRIGLGTLTFSSVWIGAISTDGSTVKPLTIESSSLYSTTDTVTKPTAGLWTGVSDIRIKENIKKYTRGLSEILKLNPIEYQLNEASGYSKEIREKINRGLIANEVEEIMPECVGRINHRGLGEIRSLDITPITYAMVNAIKELNNRLESLEKAA